MNVRNSGSDYKKDDFNIPEEFNARVIRKYILEMQKRNDGESLKSSPELIKSNILFLIAFLFIVSISLLIINDMLLVALGTAIIVLILLMYFLLGEHLLNKKYKP